MEGRPQAAVRRGQVRRHEALGAVSVYRVVTVDPPIVVMEVVEVPGLDTGTTVRLMLDQVAAMALVGARSAGRSGPLADAA